MVESQPSKLLVASSILVSRSRTPKILFSSRFGEADVTLLALRLDQQQRPQYRPRALFTSCCAHQYASPTAMATGHSTGPLLSFGLAFETGAVLHSPDGRPYKPKGPPTK